MLNEKTVERMTFLKRIVEATSILAAGILRLKKKENGIMRNTRISTDNRLDVSVEKSVHCTSKPLPKEENR